jgi:hypothetical protein
MALCHITLTWTSANFFINVTEETRKYPFIKHEWLIRIQRDSKDTFLVQIISMQKTIDGL